MALAKNWLKTLNGVIFWKLLWNFLDVYLAKRFKMFSMLGFGKLLFQDVYLLSATDFKIFLTSTVTQANRTYTFGVTWVVSDHVFFCVPRSMHPRRGALSSQAPFHLLGRCMYRSAREGEIQLFFKLDLSYGSPADRQRTQVSSSDTENPSRQKLFPQSLIISQKPNPNCHC